MIRVGITGGIGSGKSLICKIIQSMGYPVYHADVVAKKLSNTHPFIVKKISALLGEEIYINGMLDRKKVGQMVFGNDELLQKLNNIVHPVVKANFDEWCNKHNAARIAFQEAAILFESGANKWVDVSVTVFAPKQLRIKRVEQRDGLTKIEIMKRMEHQFDDKILLEKSDYAIYNDEQKLVVPQIIAIINEILDSQKFN